MHKILRDDPTVRAALEELEEVRNELARRQAEHEQAVRELDESSRQAVGLGAVWTACPTCERKVPVGSSVLADELARPHKLALANMEAALDQAADRLPQVLAHRETELLSKVRETPPSKLASLVEELNELVATHALLSSRAARSQYAKQGALPRATLSTSQVVEAALASTSLLRSESG